MPMERTTITVSRRTLEKLRRIKEEMRAQSYDELLEALIRAYRREVLEEVADKVVLSETEAEEIREIIEERRASWWRRSY